MIAAQPRGKAIELPPVPTPAPLIVYVSGAVTNPGTYVLSQGSRVVDGLEAAGGLTVDADASAANLAAELEDGQQIYIPATQDVSIPPGRFSPASAAPVNINTASMEDLISLPGIGEVTARAIIAYREKFGAFDVIDDILFVDGIGPVTLEEIRTLISTR